MGFFGRHYSSGYGDNGIFEWIRNPVINGYTPCLAVPSLPLFPMQFKCL